MRVAVALCFFFFSLAAFAQQVTVQVDANLLAEPRVGAAVSGKVAKGTRAEVIGKQAAWLNLKTVNASGWILSFNVRYPGDGSAAASGARTVTPGKPNVAATIGIRGLDAEDLKSAKFDQQQLTLLESYSATKDEAARFAQSTGLVALKLDYFIK